MASTLRVDPERLTAAAAVQVDVGASVSGMGVGRPLVGAAPAMAGLESGTACLSVAALLEEVATEVGAALTAHADRLVAAADLYRATDIESARRLRRIAD